MHSQPHASNGGYRRFKDYDYSGGAAVFVTFCVRDRRRLFGFYVQSDSPRSETRLTHAGEALLDTMKREASRGGGVELKRFSIMPDHVHMRLYLHPGIDRPLAKLAQFVSNVKRWAKWKCGRIGLDFDWEEGYHDRLCLGREIIDRVDLYIDNNPLKWRLMHDFPPPLRVVEPLDSRRLPGNEWWSAVGNTSLFDATNRIAAVRLSRRIRQNDFFCVVARLMKAVDRGFVLAGTFISPCERELADALAARGAPMIRAVPDELATIYRPRGDETRQFAAGNLLLLSRVVASGSSRSAAWHGMNAALGDAARAVEGGVSLYVKDDLNFTFSS